MSEGEKKMQSSETNTAQSEPSRLKAYLKNHMREYGLLFALIAIMAFFQIVTAGTLMRPVNITNLFLQNSYIIIMALGMRRATGSPIGRSRPSS